MNKGCDNCYYEYFDEKAYPCSLCVRGIKRTDKWMPSKKTKAEIQTETSTNSEKVQLTVEPQTETWSEEKNKAFYNYLWNVINPNDMDEYMTMFESHGSIPINGKERT